MLILLKATSAITREFPKALPPILQALKSPGKLHEEISEKLKTLVVFKKSLTLFCD
jgi:hypothetical protein